MLLNLRFIKFLIKIMQFALY